MRPQTVLCNVENLDALERLITRVEPDVIINCIGILIGGSTKSTSRAIRVNALLPQFLLELSLRMKFFLIHVSTDCVFSGKMGGYDEDSIRDADDVYGRTKALGEISASNALTIRTSIIGPELKTNGEGLVHWFLSNPQRQIRGYSRAYWGGVTTNICADAIIHAVRHRVTGLWNLTNGLAISKYDLLSLMNSQLPKALIKEIANDEGKKSNKSLVSKRSDISFQVPQYDEMITTMFKDIYRQNSRYLHYNFEI